MHQFIPRRSGTVRFFIACLIIFTLFTTPLASLAASRKQVVFKASPSLSAPGKSSDSTAVNSSVSNVSAANALLVPTITASKVDALFTDVNGDTNVDPGDTLEYTVTIQNTGTDATGVTFTDTIDTHTTLVGGSLNTSPIAFDDSGYTATGNIRISVNAASGVLTNDIDPDSGTNAGLTASAGATSTNGGNVVMSADGSFTYNPAPGFEGADTFTYTVTDGSGATGTGTVSVTVSGMIWFIQAGALGGGDGRLTSPFNCLVGAGCFDPVAADGVNDNIFLYTGAYTGGLTLLNGQRFIGQGANLSITAITGLTPPAGSDPLPSTGGTDPTITTAAAATNALNLGSGNTLIGFTVGNTTGTDISGNGFGTASITDITLNGTGRALSLINGTLTAGSISSITVDSSSSEGILLQQVAGALTIGGTTITSSTTQGIHVTTSTADVSFGNTSVGNNTVAAEPTVGVRLNANSAGTRTFGTLTIQNTSQQAFVHAAAGGTTTITGATTITNPTLGGIDIQDSTTAISFQNANITQSGGTGVFIDDSTGSVSFADLDITPDNNQRGLHITDHNTGTITTTSGSITTTGTGTGVEINPTSGTTPLSMTLTLVSVNGAPSGVVIRNNTGSFSLIGDNTNARNGSGGVMTNTTDDGIRLTGANNITLKSINLNSPGDTLQALIEDNEDETGEHGVEAIGGSNIILSGVLIDAPAGSGMVARNLTGTSRINNNSLITNIDNPATHGLFIRNDSVNNTLFEVNDTDFTNSSSGASTLNATNSGTANMTVEVRNGCIFEALSSQAITMAGGALAGTTGTLTSLVTGNTFRNAAGVSENNVAAVLSNGATHNATISNNLLENIAEDGTVANTSIIRTQNSGGKMTAVVSGNTIQNIAYGAGAGGRHVIGHVFEPISFNAANFSDLKFENNTVTNVTYTATNREFIYISYREQASGGDIKILGNNWNMPTVASTSESIELEFRNLNAATIDTQISNNTGTVNTGTRFLNIDNEDAATTNFTITNNSFTNSHGAAGPTIDVATLDNAAAGDASACVNVSGNTLSPNTILLTESANTTMTVTQTSASGAEATSVRGANSNATVTVSGTPTFGVAACTLPVNNLRDIPSFSPVREAVAAVSAEHDGSSIVAVATGVAAPQSVESAPVTADSNVTTAIRRHSHHAVSKIKRAYQAVTNLVAGSAPMMLAGETVTVNGSGSGFTLPQNKTITIKFKVTVNDPPNLTLLNPARVSNQGTVEGTNFTDVLTDDPAAGGTADPTETLIDLYDSQTAVITSSPSIVQGDSVTFTATVTPVSSGPTPVTGTVDFFDGTAIPANLIAGCDDRPLSGDPAQATCTTSALTAAGSPHTITALYNADGGNYDASSGTVMQTVILVPDLTIDKQHAGSFFQGQTGATYTITVTNSGNGAMPTGQTISVTDTLPDGLTATAMTGTGWTCQPTAPPNTFPVAGPTTLSCARTGDTALAAAASYPNITLTVNVDNDAPTGNPALSNDVSVTQGAGGEVNTGNNSDTDPTAINAGVDLTIDKSHTDIFTQGDTGKTYTITVTNNGGTATSGTVTVTDTLPTGLTPTAPNGAHNGWTCTIVGQDLTCTRSDALNPAASYPDITLTVDVANNAPTSVDNTATVANAGDVNGTNNSDTDQTTINQLCLTPPANMVAWWTGDDTPRDIAGGNDGTLNGNAGYAAGKVLNGFNLDGTGDFVQAPDSNSLDLTTAITIDAWVNPTNANTSARLVDKISPGNTDGYLFDLNAGKLRFIAGTATAESTATIPAGVLTHVAVTYDGANISFYINGVLDSTTADTGAIPVNALPLRIGAAQDGTFAFQGVIDEVEIFSTALPVADILGIHDAGAGGKCKPADLTISKTHTDPFQQGSTGNDYTITVHNDGPGDTVGTTTVTDTLPAGLTATAMTGTGWTCAPTAPPNTFPVAGPTTIACTSTDVIASGADFPVITLTVDVGANTASVTNTVTVSNAAEMDTTDNTDSDLTNLNAQADLQIVSKTDAPDPVLAGQDITYSISFINNGPSDASTVTVTDAVPAGTTFVSASVTVGTGWAESEPSVGGTGNVIFSKGTVAVGETATFQVVVKTAANTVEGSIVTNNATAASATSDPTANNTGTAMTTVNQSDIEITSKTDTPDPVNAGENITYTVNFKNNSAVTTASTVTVTDAVPANTTLVSATTASAGWGRTDVLNAGDTGNVVFSKASVPGGETAQFTIVVKVNANTASGTVISNTATSATASIDTNSANDSKTATTTVATSADLEIVSKTDTPDPVTAGQNITYAINFQNNGPSDATGVTVTDGVPTGTTFVSAAITASSSAGWSRTDAVSVGGTGDIVFSNSSVPSGATATFEVVVKVNSNVTTTISNTATAAGTTSDPTPGNDSDTETTTTQASADVSITSKSDTPDPVVISTNLTYTINFINNGPSDAVNATVADPLPAGTTLVSTVEPAGWTRTDAVAAGTNGIIVFAKASVPAGEMATFIIVVAIDAGVADGTVLTNTATAASATTDGTSANDSASTTTTVTTTLALTVNTTGDQPDANIGDRICDVDLGTGGDQCTLRAAIQETNAAATADTIDFSLPASSTIELTSALPAIAGDLEINGPTNGLTIDGNSTGRVFEVTSGTVSIDPLTITGGLVNGGHGAGLLVTGGDVTVKDLLFTANTAVNGNGGAIAVTGGLLTILNTTISGNTATNGGGVYLGGGGLTMINVTVTNNTANGDTGSGPTATGDGGGLHIGANPTLVRNTIIAGNTATTNADASGTVPLGNNLTGGAPRLAPLADNGGPTMTHALLAGSPALDAGDNTQATTAGLINDQRGFDRITDGNGDAVDTVDIGAFEAQVFVEDIADRAIDEDGSDSFSFNVGGAAAITNVTATSSNTALVPNSMANLDVTGAGGTRTLTITPVVNGFGSTIITVTVESASGSMSDTFVFTVNPVNDPPSFTGGPNVVVSEDAGPQSIPSWATGISPGPANESTQTLTFLVSNGNNSLFSVQPAIAANGTLTFTPAANANGVATVSVQLQDNGGGMDSSPFPPYQFTITVNAVNDAPTANGQSVNTNEDTALGITLTGSDTETPSGSLIFTITDQPDNGVLSGTGANRTYTPNANYNGPDSFKFTVTDTGDGLSPALTSAEATVNITVNAVNDAPTANGQSVNTNEDTPLPITLTGSDVETASGSLIFNVTVQPTNGVLSGTGANRTYTPNANFNGADSFKFTVTDTGDGSSAALTSAEATVNITVNAVNDGPVNTVPGAQSVTENSTLTFSAGNGNQISIADVDAGAPGVRVTLTATNGTLTLSSTAGLAFTVGDGTADATMTFTGTVASINTALNGLVFTPTSGFDGAASLQIVTNDLGNTGSGGALSDSDTINITVNAGGAMQFSSATYNVNESGGSATITITRTGGSAGTATVLFETSNGTADSGDYTTVSQTVTFVDGDTSETVNIPITDDLFNEPDQTVNLTLSNAGGSGQLGTPVNAVLTIVDDDAAGGIVRFNSATFTVGESSGPATITVERIGTTTNAFTVDYQSSDHSNPPDFVDCTAPGPGLASSRCDFTTAVGTLQFAAGQTSATFTVLISQDNDVEGTETLSLTLSNPTGGAVLGTPSSATLEITDDPTEPAANPIDTSSEFVKQHYRDFLNREADAPGLAFWTDNIEKCHDPARRPADQTVEFCIDKQRESTAIAFFVAPEFQMTGGFVYRLYKGSLPGTPDYDGSSPPGGRFPTFLEFMRDVRQVADGIVVSDQISGAKVEANREQLAQEFVQRPEFVALYGGLNNTQYVDALFNVTGITPSQADKDALVAELNNAPNATQGRASVLRKIVDGTQVIAENNVPFTTTYGEAFHQQEFTRTFVFMEYIGYLRRNPDDAGFVHWLTKLNFFGGDPFQAEMVRAFIISPEYRSRFGQP